jgi:hypothetical protein
MKKCAYWVAMLSFPSLLVFCFFAMLFKYAELRKFFGLFAAVSLLLCLSVWGASKLKKL